MAKQQENIARIDAYNLLDYSLALQAKVLEGYRVDTSNLNYPQTFGSHFTAGLVSNDTENVDLEAMQNSKPVSTELEKAIIEADLEGVVLPGGGLTDVAVQEEKPSTRSKKSK